MSMTGSLKVPMEDGLPGQQVHPIEAAHTTDDQRGEAAILKAPFFCRSV